MSRMKAAIQEVLALAGLATLILYPLQSSTGEKLASLQIRKPAEVTSVDEFQVMRTKLMEQKADLADLNRIY